MVAAVLSAGDLGDSKRERTRQCREDTLGHATNGFPATGRQALPRVADRFSPRALDRPDLPLTEFSYEPDTIRLPALPDLNEWASQKLTAHLHAARLTGRSVDFFAHHRDTSLDLSLPGQGDVVRKIFDRAGVPASLSSAGEVTGRIIEQMGGLPACRIFRIPGVRKLLAAGKPQNGAEVLCTLEDEGTLNRDYRRAGTAQEILDKLLRLQVLQARLQLQCPECRIRQLYLPEALATEVKCPNCQSTFSSRTAPAWKQGCVEVCAVRPVRRTRAHRLRRRHPRHAAAREHDLS